MLELDDLAIDALVKSPGAKAWDHYLSAFSNMGSRFMPTHKISKTLIVKNRKTYEVENMRFVRANTKVPVPQARYLHLKSWLVMDFIEGKMLQECWESQSFFMKFRIACTLRGYISQLRKLRGTIPGTVSGGVISGILFEDENRGPFDSSRTFRNWCHMVAHSGWTSTITAGLYKREPVPPAPVTSEDWDLVFTHGDLNLTNIILSKDGVLWIIDWATSGFFPPCVESVVMKYYDDAPESWKRFRWFIAGTYPNCENFWQFFITDVHRFRRG